MKDLLRNLAYASMIIAALSVSIHELAGTARATGGPHEIVAGSDQFGRVVAGDGTVYVRDRNAGGDFWTRIGQYSGLTAAPVALEGAEILLVNGDVFRLSYPDGATIFVANVFGGPSPTAVTPQSWSQIKAREWRR